MSEATDKTIALNVRLKPSESSARDEPHERRLGPGDCRCRFRLPRANVACRYRKDREGWAGRAEGIGLHACHPRGDGGGRAGAVASADSASVGRAE